jgi:cyclopropane-fatty-acyl-phospholipid synthase
VKRPAWNALDAWLLSQLQRAFRFAPVSFALLGDEQLARERGVGTLVIRDRRTLFSLLLDPELNIGEAYMRGSLEARGDLEAIIEAVYRTWERGRLALRSRLELLRERANDLRRARRNVHTHYDLGNDFYRLWLDRELVYTCAYFASPEQTLEQAQREKMDLVCRKLRLRPGLSVVEAGCGWGALALHMARHYGVRVTAFNISKEQIAWARARAEREGLSGRVVFVEDDYRNVQGRYDVFVSVGMLEHVGRRHYARLSEVIDRCLDRTRGRGLLHFIGRDQPLPLNPWIRKRIFPGTYPPTLREAVGGVLEPHAFSVLDVENLRLHYARTLGHWLERFESAQDRIQSQFDERFVRAWRLYLAGSQASFATGWMQLFQIVFGRPDDNDVPWTREYMERRAAA